MYIASPSRQEEFREKFTVSLTTTKLENMPSLGVGKREVKGEGPHLLSSLYHWNSAEGTAEASHCRVPFCPTGTPVPFASEMYGGSAERRRPVASENTFSSQAAASLADCIFHSLIYRAHLSRQIHYTNCAVGTKSLVVVLRKTLGCPVWDAAIPL